MSLHSDRRSSFFLAALAVTTASLGALGGASGCTAEGASEPLLSEQRAEGREAGPPADAPATRSIQGKVLSSSDAPIAGAVITTSGADGAELAVISDSEGLFSLDGLPPSDAILTVAAGHYETARVPVSLTSAEVLAVLNVSSIPWPPLVQKKGLTWVKALHDGAKGQDQVSCHDYTIVGSPTPSPTPTRSCDPYVGDTKCNLARPILCLKPDGSGSNGHVWSFYNGWAAGNLGITHPIVGTQLTSLAVANAFCVAEFGAGWRMASHHDGNFGGGWQWRGYGNLNTLYAVQEPGHTLDHRFWVYILEGSGPTPWDPTNPPNQNPNLVPGNGKAGDDFSAQLATAGNCWN